MRTTLFAAGLALIQWAGQELDLGRDAPEHRRIRPFGLRRQAGGEALHRVGHLDRPVEQAAQEGEGVLHRRGLLGLALAHPNVAAVALTVQSRQDGGPCRQNGLGKKGALPPRPAASPPEYFRNGETQGLRFILPEIFRGER